MEIVPERGPPDIRIRDRPDSQGIIAAGAVSSTRQFLGTLQRNLDDVIVRMRSSLSEVDIEFPGLSKNRLDEIRRAVTPTVDGHHLLKACGGRIASTVASAERLLKEGKPRERILSQLELFLEQEYPQEGDRIVLEHVKLDGQLIQLGPGIIKARTPDRRQMRFERIILGAGRYDGLEVRKEPGDKALTEVRQGAWYTRTFYYSSQGRLKGAYVNLNTPVEFYPTAVRYVDLEVDVVKESGAQPRVVDLELLDQALELGIITKSLHKKVMEEVDSLVETLEK